MAFKNVNCLTLSSVAALALLTTATVQAIPLDNPTISGSPSTTYVVDTNDNTLLVEDTMNTALSAVLTGSAANPGGNVELGKLASEPATVLSGTLDGSAFTASSLTLDDWTANDNALAETYITAAATAISDP